MEATMDEIDERLERDLRMRARITRAERPEAVVDLLGDRPRPGPAAREWDMAAGRLAQHQAAFDIAEGLGRRPSYLDRSAYAESRAVVEELVEPLRPQRVIEREVPSIEIDF
jgi:hypothetical protein